MTDGLAALEQRLAQDLLYLALPPRQWMPAPQVEGGQPVHDVVIIGAGQAGLAAAVGLMHLGIQATVLDRAPLDFEGPWATTARMEELRSPKELLGPAMGLPALTFRAWFEAQFGLAAWSAMDKIPRLQWMDYLRWYRRVMKIDVRNATAVTAVTPRADKRVQLSLQTPSGASSLLARRVILATGRDGLGGPIVPDIIKTLPQHLWAHSSDSFDYAALKGMRVGVIGAGASSMDSAATALEAGAASVDLLIRRADLPRVNKSKGSGNPGLTHGHLHLQDEHKWRLRHYINTVQLPPPHGSTLRVSRNSNARFLFNCPIESVNVNEGVDVDGVSVCVDTPRGAMTYDFLIAGTGFAIDWSSRPELAALAPHVQIWRDGYQPPSGAEDAELADSPRLGSVFEFQEKSKGSCPGLDRIHCFCYPAMLTHGSVSGDIPNISDGAKRLATGIASQFYSEDFEHHFQMLEAYDVPELLGDEWRPS
jgi:FAD-dependent urate hydroxylase